MRQSPDQSAKHDVTHAYSAADEGVSHFVKMIACWALVVASRVAAGCQPGGRGSDPERAVPDDVPGIANRQSRSTYGAFATLRCPTGPLDPETDAVVQQNRRRRGSI